MPTKQAHARLASAWREVIDALEYDSDNPHLADSPARVARFMSEWHTMGKDPPDMTLFPNTEKIDEMVVTESITFFSMCAHHGLPFVGKAAIGYIPRKSILGLSKFVRVVRYFSQRFQTQEDLTAQIADFLSEHLEPKGLGVVMRAEHFCMSMRGVQCPNHSTITSAMRGALMKKHAARAELLALLKG